MTSIQPDIQATGHPLTSSLPIVVIVDESRTARHRVEPIAAPNVIPAWVQLIVTVIAFAAGAVGIRATASAEQLVVFGGVAILTAAVMILAAVFWPDVDAAIRARIGGESE